MRLEDQERSSNVEDRCGIPVGRGVAGGGIGIVVIALVAMFFGVDPSLLLNSGSCPLLARSGHSRGCVQPIPSEWDQASGSVFRIKVRRSRGL